MSTLPHDGSFVPYLIVDGADAAIAFYAEAFDAVEVGRLMMPDGKVGHAELTIAGQAFYLADHTDWMDGTESQAPTRSGSTGTTLTRYVATPADVDAAFAKAVAAGATPTKEPEDQFYGDRLAEVRDPFGHRWSFQARLKDMTFDEMDAAMREAYGG